MSNREKAYVCVVALLVLPVSMVLHGGAAVLLWRWFAEPLGAPAIQAGHAIGLMILVNLTRSRRKIGDDETSAELIGRFLGEAVLSPLVAVFLGWVVKAVML